LEITPIVKINAGQEIVDQIIANIMAGTWVPGTKLPSEKELGQLFAVSRVPVRDALNKLRAMGVVTTRQGEGTFVATLSPGMFMNSLLPLLMLNAKNMMDVLQFRRIIEPESAALAAINADPSDLKRIKNTLDEMKRIGRPGIEFSTADALFHLDIARGTKNSMIFNASNVVKDLLVHYYRKIVDLRGIEGALHYHPMIYQAILDRNSNKAREIMTEHVMTTIDDIAKIYQD
jgi:DNA-binding FadR family transcriptional regulator